MRMCPWSKPVRIQKLLCESVSAEVSVTACLSLTTNSYSFGYFVNASWRISASIFGQHYRSRRRVELIEHIVEFKIFVVFRREVRHLHDGIVPAPLCRDRFGYAPARAVPTAVSNRRTSLARCPRRRRPARRSRTCRPSSLRRVFLSRSKRLAGVDPGDGFRPKISWGKARGLVQRTAGYCGRERVPIIGAARFSLDAYLMRSVGLLGPRDLGFRVERRGADQRRFPRRKFIDNFLQRRT